MNKFLAVSIVALVATGCASSPYQPIVTEPVSSKDTQVAQKGRNAEDDLKLCNAKAENDPVNAGAVASVTNQAINAVINSVTFGRVSPYSVSGVASRGANAAVNSEFRKRRVVDSCMKQRGWEVY
jgi:hypothetical protein